MLNAFLIQHFSYGVLFIWSIFEGEIGLAIAGFLAYEGDLRFEYVIAIAIAGAFIGDTALFLIGYFFKTSVETWLQKYEKRVKRIEEWFQHYGDWVILFERFIYGTHIPALLIIGVSGFGFIRFLLLDIAGVILWAFTFTMLGYFFGQAVIDILMLVQRHFSVVLLLLIFFFIVYQFYKTGNDNSDKPDIWQ